MQLTSIFLAVAFFSANTFAQIGGPISNYIQEPNVSSELARFPSSFVSQLASAVPKIDNDILGYVSTLVKGPSFSSVVSELNPVLPNDAKSQLAADPANFVINLLTASTPPDWETAIPSDLAGYFFSVDRDVRNIITSGVTIPTQTLQPRPGSSRPSLGPISSSTAVATSSASTVTTAPAGTGVLNSSGLGGVSPTGTGSGGTSRIFTPTNPPNPSATPFNSASRWSGMIGAAAALMAVGVGALLLA